MKSWKFTKLTGRALAGLLAVSALSSMALADDSEGVVRIQKPADNTVELVKHDENEEEVIRAQNEMNRRQQRRTDNGQQRRGNDDPQNCPPQQQQQQQQDCRNDYYYSHPLQAIHDCETKQAFDGWLQGQAMMHRSRTQLASIQLRTEMHDECREKSRWAACKFGYFLPSGCCGKGCPPIGHYSMVYPVNPAHFDQRDGQVYAAQGYGGPVSVPLAPVVGHTYNYGWGIPSSRLTPVSHPVSPGQAQAYQGQGMQAVPVQP